jgi:hypothetical protein
LRISSISFSLHYYRTYSSCLHYLVYIVLDPFCLLCQRCLDRAASAVITAAKTKQTEILSSHSKSNSNETTTAAAHPLRRVRSDAFSVGSTATHLNRRVPWPWRWLLAVLSKALFMPPDAAAAAALAVVARAAASDSATCGTSRGCEGTVSRRSDRSCGVGSQKSGGLLFTCCQDTTQWLSDAAKAGGPQLWARSEAATGTPFDVTATFRAAASG